MGKETTSPDGFKRALASLLGAENLAKISRVRIGLAGAGGLGSNCAQFLVRSGFKRFKIVDFDRVEQSNLNRQFFFAKQVGRLKVLALQENLLQINPELEIEVLTEKIAENNVSTLFDHCDAVVEALDRPDDKKMVVGAYLYSGKLLVAASGLAGWGGSDGIVTRRIRDNFYLVGDMESEVSPLCPPMAPRVVIAAAKQADIVLSYFLQRQ
ncbi:sulfur carrier protein ThiS adenylyltransferase ThiF [Desulfotomaculum copahuensis]|uniref:Thiamine biosynthesis protein ThiF n=1 Tax=Desulfotomaculum copahuensis TaxID=1838280 RepID=A0A1B7LEK9_9FIRM|nr:sulfur carrier protein ThiS adenylyltransferase ThiF [Desulfotomaculum copahuensis]OAT81676.1 thiamine biosynthesis protein ThiF [Desulfotomaculum copahuensis]